MANGKIVKYKKVFKIVVEGKADLAKESTVIPALEQTEVVLFGMVAALNKERAWHNVSIKEVKR